MITVCGSEKGGVGKSTLSANLSVMLALSGQSVIGVDCDPQGAFAFFGDIRREDGLEPKMEVRHMLTTPGEANPGQALREGLVRLAKDFDHMVIDCGGFNSYELRAAFLAADILVSPILPGATDMRAVNHLVENVRQAKRYNPKMRPLFVLNRCNTNLFVRTAVQVRRKLETVDIFEVLDGQLHERVSYNYAYGGGRAVVELSGRDRDRKAANEIEYIYGEIFNG